MKNFDNMASVDLFLAKIGALNRFPIQLDEIIRLENNGKVKCVAEYRERVKNGGLFVETFSTYLDDHFSYTRKLFSA